LKVLTCQNFISIPTDSNYFWRQYSICPNYQYQIKYKKDTIINFKTYNKYSTFGGEYGQGACQSFIRNGFLRQDTIAKSLFILDNALQEHPLFNFSKSLGDTMQSYDRILNSNVTLTIVSTSTVNMNDGTKRKGYWTNDNNCFVEGMGSIFGGIYCNKQPLQAAYKTEQLICFGIQTPYQVLCSGLTTFSLNCSFIPTNVSVKENLLNAPDIDVFPNPSHDEVTVSINDDKGRSGTITIYNVLGFGIKEIQTNWHEGSNNLIISISDLPRGIYFVTIEGSEGLHFTKKLLKE
jgi:hypothetical protein